MERHWLEDGRPLCNCWICAMCNKTTVLFSKARILFWPPYRDLLSAPIQPIGSRLGLGLGVAKISRWPPLHPREGGFEMGSVVTMAPADVTNLPLILHSAPILTPWSQLSYLIFWPLTWLSFWLNFQRSFEPFCNSIQALPPNSGSWLWNPLLAAKREPPSANLAASNLSTIGIQSHPETVSNLKTIPIGTTLDTASGWLSWNSYSQA
jgi:hypothetical protein